MKAKKIFGAIAITAITTLLGCKGVRPILPAKPLPPGTLQMYFVRKITGPVDLTIDGTRIPVEQRKKKANLLTVSGLSQGKHHYFITSHIDVIGPDYGDFEIGSDVGVFQVHLTQKLKSVFYESDTTTPIAEGLHGVKAVLE